MPVAVTEIEKQDKHLAVGHNCVDYPITFYIASKAVNSGSVVAPRIIATSCVFFGQGHPLNRTETMYPDSEDYMPMGATTGPRLSIISRRSLLRALLQALVSVKDIYRVGRASTCLHINVSSQYLDIVWNKWLPDWEKNGWPTREQEAALHGDKNGREGSIVTKKSANRSSRSQQPRQRADSRASTRLSIQSGVTAMTGDAQLIFDDSSDRLINEDLLRKIAVYRRNFFKSTDSNSKGAAYLQLIDYRHNPADRLAKEFVTASSLDLTTQLPRPGSIISRSGGGAGSIFSSDGSSIRSLTGRGGAPRAKASSIYSQTSPPRKGTGPALSSLREQESSRESQVAAAGPQPTGMVAQPVTGAPSFPPMRPVRSPRKAAAPAPAIAPVPVPAQQTAPQVAQRSVPVEAAVPVNATAAAPTINMAALGAPVMTQRPVQPSRKSSKAPPSESGYDTEQDEFNDAASTFSDDKKEPESTLSKIVGIPTAVVAATVAAVMAPSNDVKTEEAISPPVEPVTGKRGSFAVETEKALDNVKVPAAAPARPVLVPKRLSSYGKSSKAAPNVVEDGLQREPSTKKERKSTQMEREPSTKKERRSAQLERDSSSKKKKSGELSRGASVRRSGELSRGQSVNGYKGADMTRETSRVSKRSANSRNMTLAESNKMARQISQRSATRRPVIEPSSQAAPAIRRGPSTPPPSPPKPKQRNSFFSLRGKKSEKSSKSSEPYRPPMDRLIDYRPPQSRNLRTPQTSGEQSDPVTEDPVTSPSISSPIDEDSSPVEKVKAEPKPAAKGGPFSFFKKRASSKKVT